VWNSPSAIPRTLRVTTACVPWGIARTCSSTRSWSATASPRIPAPRRRSICSMTSEYPVPSCRRLPIPGRSVAPGRVAYSADDLGHTETLFAVGNGYLGMRANPEEGRDAHSHGTYLNGFHETWGSCTPRRVRLREDRPDDRQRARRQADQAVRRRRAAAAGRGRPRQLRTGPRLPNGVLTRDLIWRRRPANGCKVSSSGWSASPTATSP
jgi:hypothetical protein